MSKYEAELIRRLESGEPRHETKLWFINCWNDPDMGDFSPLEEKLHQELMDDCDEAAKYPHFVRPLISGPPPRCRQRSRWTGTQPARHRPLS